MMILVPLAATVVSLLTVAVLVMPDWDRPPIESVQTGYRGLAMEYNYNPRKISADMASANQQVPAPPYELEVYPDAPMASDFYENVQVLGDVSTDEFNYLMQAMANWVVPDADCGYCHNLANLADESKYTFQVSRRMLQMTIDINSNWDNHVADTGVTCFTCHRGQPVPEHIWFNDAPTQRTTGMVQADTGQNKPAPEINYTSLPRAPFQQFLAGDNDIRVVSHTALPVDNKRTVMRTEWTYALMTHISQSLGVGCTYCHNSRSFFAWDQSPPTRTTAYHGIDMTQHLNNEYLDPLQPVYPAVRLGPTGDAPKANCGTCHNGAYKPFYGAKMLQDYPALAGTPATAMPETVEQ